MLREVPVSFQSASIAMYAFDLITPAAITTVRLPKIPDCYVQKPKNGIHSATALQRGQTE